ncbi:hypothetical protein VIGAN_01536300, partial [Vigna angularis var. angularis]
MLSVIFHSSLSHLILFSPHQPKQQYLFLTPIQNHLNYPQFLKTYNPLYYISSQIYLKTYLFHYLLPIFFTYALHRILNLML